MLLILKFSIQLSLLQWVCVFVQHNLLLFPVESSKVGFGWCCGIKCGHKHSGDTIWRPSKPAKWCGEKLLCIKSLISKKIYPSTQPGFTIYFIYFICLVNIANRAELLYYYLYVPSLRHRCACAVPPPVPHHKPLI